MAEVIWLMNMFDEFVRLIFFRVRNSVLLLKWVTSHYIDIAECLKKSL